MIDPLIFAIAIAVINVILNCLYLQSVSPFYRLQISLSLVRKICTSFCQPLMVCAEEFKNGFFNLKVEHIKICRWKRGKQF